MVKWLDEWKRKVDDLFSKPKLPREQILVKQDLGLPSKGLIAAFGHFTSDRGLDVFVIDETRSKVTVYIWNRKTKQYEDVGAVAKLEDAKKMEIFGVIPSDFNHDGFLDLLVMSRARKESDRESVGIANHLYEGDGKDTLKLSTIKLPKTKSEPIVFDYKGNLRSDLLGVLHGASEDILTVIHSIDSRTPKTETFSPVTRCKLAPNHWSAYADISGDGRPDLLLHCDDELVILKNGDAEYVDGGRIKLPKGSSQISLMDVDGDGALDLVFTTPSDKTLHIVYNSQRPFCTDDKEKDSEDCKPNTIHFKEDSQFGFRLNDPVYHQRIPLQFKMMTSDDTGPIPLSIGDFDLDGFPDILLTVDEKQSHVTLLRNVPCAPGLSGCSDAVNRRTFTESFEEVDNLSKTKGITRAVFADVAGNGDLSIMAEGKNEKNTHCPIITTFLNDGYSDAFFVRAECLNGVCPYPCMNEKTESGAVDPYGVNYSGASFKLSFTDMNGDVQVRTGTQLSQTGNRACQLPFVVMGLGRTNSFVDLFSTACSLRSLPDGKKAPTIVHAGHQEHIIPNSDLIISPPHPDSDGQWGYQIHIHPAAHLPWVAFTLAMALILLTTLTAIFKMRERAEDERERKKKAHAINFDAM